VDLREADIEEVLRHIAQQVDIRMIFGPSSGKRISVEFAEIELEQGLHRLLRLASLSSMILYASGATGAPIIKELHVFGEAQEESPGLPSVTEGDIKDQVAAASERFTQALAQAHTMTAPAIEGQESPAIRLFREELEGALRNY
jgi:hypothetical protein